MSVEGRPSLQHRTAELLLRNWVLYVAVLRPVYLLRRRLSRVRP